MIMSFLIVGAMFFLTANQESESHQEVKEVLMVVETKQILEPIIEEVDRVELVVKPKVVVSSSVKIVEEKVIVSESPKVVSKVKKVEVVVVPKKEKPIEEEKIVQKIETPQKKIQLESTPTTTTKINSVPNIPSIPTVPKIANYDIKVPVPETSLTPVKVEAIKE